MKKISILILGLSSIAFTRLAAQDSSRQLSLSMALELAAKGNKTLQAQQLETFKANEAVEEAKSYRKPSVNAQASYTIFAELPVIYLRDESASPKVNDVKYAGHFAFDGSIGAQYPLVNPVFESRIRHAKIDVQQADLKTRMSNENIAFHVTRLYLGLLMNTEQQEVLLQSLQRNERALADAKAFYLQGKALKTDTLSHHLAVQQLKLALSNLASDRRNAFSQLNVLLGTADSTNWELTDKIANNFPSSLHETENISFEQLIQQRHDIRLSNIELLKNKEQLNTTRAAFKPQLWATAAYQIQSQTDDFQFWKAPVPRTSFVGVRLNVPIYSGNRLRHQRTQAQLNIQQKELAIAELTSQANAELSTIERNYQQAQHEWKVQQERAQAASVSYNMLYDRYRHGIATRLELNDAELALTQAKLSTLQASYKINLLQLEWQKATSQLTR